MWRTFFDSAARLLFAPQCYVCNQELTELPGTDGLLNRFFCPECHEALIINDCIRCNFCDALLFQERPGTKYCSHCRGHEYHFDKVIALGLYDGLLRECALMIKHPEHRHLAAALADALYLTRRKEFNALSPDWIVPVPMHELRKQYRGVNDAEVIAQRLAELMRKSYRDAVVRVQSTMPQKDLGPQERRFNLQNAFRWKWWVEPEKPPESVLLVDDILTTGATGSEIAKMMKRSGVKNVWVAVIARAIGKNKQE